MEYLDILREIVNSLGFPIAMVVYFIWDKNKAMESMTTAIKNNTDVITLLAAKLDSVDLIKKD